MDFVYTGDYSLGYMLTEALCKDSAVTFCGYDVDASQHIVLVHVEGTNPVASMDKARSGIKATLRQLHTIAKTI